MSKIKLVVDDATCKQVDFELMLFENVNTYKKLEQIVAAADDDDDVWNCNTISETWEDLLWLTA